MNDKVIAVVTEIAQVFKAQTKASVIAYHKAMLDDWSKASTATGLTDPWLIWPSNGRMGRNEYRTNQFKRGIVTPYLQSTPVPAIEWIDKPRDQQEQNRYTVKDTAPAIMDQRAEKQAEAEIQSFIAKMSSKLSEIVDVKPLTSAKVNGSLGRNTIRFEFVDGSGFTLSNDIIIKVSCLGKVFNQYPTRFHAVKYVPEQGTGGEIVEVNGVSEEDVRSIFHVQPPFNGWVVMCEKCSRFYPSGSKISSDNGKIYPCACGSKDFSSKMTQRQASARAVKRTTGLGRVDKWSKYAA